MAKPEWFRRFPPRSNCVICAISWRPPSTEASERRWALDVKESSISHSVSDLEDDIGVSLFIRYSSGILGLVATGRVIVPVLETETTISRPEVV